MVEKILTCQYSLIPTDAIEPPYNELVKMLQTVAVEYDGELDPDVANFLISQGLEFWNTLLHWVTKLKWNSKCKIPGGQTHARSTKPWGELLYCSLELCIQCHAGVGYKAAGYPDAAVWFEKIWIDYVIADMAHKVALMFQLESDKTSWVADLSLVLRELKNDRNPYNQMREPHLHHLINCSLKLAGKSEEFRKRYWLPYVRAYAACVTQLKFNPSGYYKTVVVKEVQHLGRKITAVYEVGRTGKSLKRIYPI